MLITSAWAVPPTFETRRATAALPGPEPSDPSDELVVELPFPRGWRDEPPAAWVVARASGPRGVAFEVAVEERWPGSAAELGELRHAVAVRSYTPADPTAADRRAEATWTDADGHVVREWLREDRDWPFALTCRLFGGDDALAAAVAAACATGLRPVGWIPPLARLAGGIPEASRSSPEPQPVACEVELSLHEPTGPADFSWTYRLELSAPDDRGRSSIQRVVHARWNLEMMFAGLSREVHELDVRSAARDARSRSVTLLQPEVDWSRWPLDLAFVGPRVDDPGELALYRLRYVLDDKRGWGGCGVVLDGPAASGSVDGNHGCSHVYDARGTCLHDYVVRHGLPE